jgi:beta-N-acetylhexosaminidase
LKKYGNVTEVSNSNIDSLLVDLKDYNHVIIGYHKTDKAWKKHEFTENELNWIQKIAESNNVVLDVFSKPYILLPIKSFENIESLIVSYQNGDIAQDVSAQIIFGAISSKGRIPVSINDFYKQGDGLKTNPIKRLGFTAPENVGLNSTTLAKIDSITNKAIDNRITPGAQVLVARKGKVVYQKSFGYHTYKKLTKVKNSDIYDVASLTKIMSTLPNVMLAYDKKKITLDTRIGEMLPETYLTNKDSIIFKDFMSHHARLQAWIPFYKATIDSVTKKPLREYYRKTYSKAFSVQVSENLFLRNDYKDSIMEKIICSDLLPKKEYRYSDFTFILLKEYLEKSNKKTLDVLAEDNFFSKIGMNNTLYNPLRKYDQDEIPPTEYDRYFRHSIIQGYVHDMAAAMQGGVAGHAGIFSNAMDVAKIMQMYLQKGYYGDTQFFSEKTFEDFNTCYFCEEGNRRGLGFDKPQLKGESPTCGCASITSFGHTGFTGGITWADPEEDLIYVFLSNRTYPDSNASNKLSRENIREKIQKVIYDSIIN